MLRELVVHYGEVGTKGDNKGEFESRLARNIRSSLKPLGGVKVSKLNNRFLVSVQEGSVEGAKEGLSKVFGVAWFAVVESSPLDYPAILEAATSALRSRTQPGDTFRLSVRRANKAFEIGSQDLARRLGEDVITELGLKVNLTSPATELFVDVISDRVLFYTEKIKGPGGLPVGTTGRVMHLLSGGIDSPASAWLMMKRGCRPIYLHFYLAPTPQSAVESKLAPLVRRLSEFGGGSKLILVPFAPYQLATQGLYENFEPTVFRYFMRLVAERLAEQTECPAISTGDNLGQVASQTLHNLSCIDRGSSLPILRPLLGFDKEEIVQLAKRIGTYETSIEEYKDCCAIISRHPKTRMRWEDVEESARRFRFGELATQCISMASVVSFGGAVDQPPLVEPLHALLSRYERRRAVEVVGRGGKTADV